jgi:leucyl-tRNA synthetase
MAKYPFADIEKKWQARWESEKAFRAVEDPAYPKDKRRYVLDMFPYPSGAGLHVGHPEGYTATDIYCRYLRMNGFNVLHPMGFDAFGLPAENYAIQTGTHPASHDDGQRRPLPQQIKALGFSYDWDREISTCTPDYYKWTQWIFLKLFERGLAYEADMPINWCPSCKTGLANEEVKDGECDRCHTKVVRKRIRQWVLKITAYADRLLEDLNTLDWPEPIKIHAAQLDRPFRGRLRQVRHRGLGEKLEDFHHARRHAVRRHLHGPLSRASLRREDNFGCAQRAAVESYVEAAARKSDLERTDLAKDKSGVFTGAYAINPAERRARADLDLRLRAHLLRHGRHHGRPRPRRPRLGIREEVRPADNPGRRLEGAVRVRLRFLQGARDLRHRGRLFRQLRRVHGNDHRGSQAPHHRKDRAGRHRQTGRQLQASRLGLLRQRYWGEPIPLVHCEKCGIVPVPEKDLPSSCPRLKSYAPSGTGESPLANIRSG